MPTSFSTKKKFKNSLEKYGAFWIDRQPGFMGNQVGTVKVPGKAEYVYVRRTNGHVVECLNNTSSAVFNTPVIIGRNKSQPKIWQIIEVRNVYQASNVTFGVQPHHSTHEFPAPDTVWVLRDQFLPLLVLPTGGFTVRLYGDIIFRFNMDNPVKVENTDIDMSSYAVTSGAKYVLMQVDSTGTISYIEGDLQPSFLALQFTPIPKPDLGKFPICAFIFYAGQTELRRDSTERTIIDLRQFTSDAMPDVGTQIDESATITVVDDADKFGVWDDSALVLKGITGANLLAQIQALIDGTIEETPPAHIHQITRFGMATGDTTIELPDFALDIVYISVAGLIGDPTGYSLSDDGGTITLSSALGSDAIVVVEYIVEGELV